MDLTLSPAEHAFREELRAWLVEHHPGPLPTGEEENFAARRAWQRELHAAGWAGVSWPQEYGGRGATLMEQAIFSTELAAAGAPAEANLLGLVMGGPTLIVHGSDEQKERFLDPILSAEEIWCQGFSEPDSGSDLASLKTRARRAPDGDGFRVTGQKVWTTYAHHAKWCMLVARTDGEAPKHKGLTYFLMDMEQDAVQVRPLHQITGEAEFNELFMEDAWIPAENVVGGVGNGWGVALTTLMYERSGLGFGAIVTMLGELDELIALARERGRDGEPAIRRAIARLKIGAEALRYTAYRGLTEQMKTGVPGPEGSLNKLQWSSVNQQLTELAFELLGPDALVADRSPWTYRFLRARANSIEGGTSEILRNIVAERVLGLPRMR